MGHSLQHMLARQQGLRPYACDTTGSRMERHLGGRRLPRCCRHLLIFCMCFQNLSPPVCLLRPAGLRL